MFEIYGEEMYIYDLSHKIITLEHVKSGMWFRTDEPVLCGT